MKTKKEYIAPTIESVQLDTENVIAASLTVSETEYNGVAGSRQRDFWE